MYCTVYILSWITTQSGRDTWNQSQLVPPWWDYCGDQSVECYQIADQVKYDSLLELWWPKLPVIQNNRNQDNQFPRCVWQCVCHQLAYQACNLQNVVIVYAKQDAGEARPGPVGEWLKGFRTYSGRGVITSCGSLNTVATVWVVVAYTEIVM